MSGGRFNYIQFNITEAADDIETGLKIYENLSDKTIDKFTQAIRVLKVAAIMLNRVDWFLSGDDGEETFHERWDKDFKKFQEENK